MHYLKCVEAPVSKKMFDIREDDLSGAATQALLAMHLAGMYANSPPGSVYALDHSGLREPGVTVWTAWLGDKLAGIGALKEIGGGAGEIKSMRTHPDHLRKGLSLLARTSSKKHDSGSPKTNLRLGRLPAPALLYQARVRQR